LYGTFGSGVDADGEVVVVVGSVVVVDGDVDVVDDVAEVGGGAAPAAVNGRIARAPTTPRSAIAPP
jgi:hypothetical protein